MSWWKKKSKENKARTVSSIEKVKVPADSLAIGMYICELDRPWAESPFLFQGFFLRNEADMEAVQQLCQFVYVDVSKQEKLEQERASSRHKKPQNGLVIDRPVKKIRFGKAPEKKVSIEKEIERASATYSKTSNLVKTMMDEVRLGNSIDSKAAKLAVSECVESVIANPDAMMWLTQLKKRDEYTSEHSLNVCLLAIAFGRHIGMPAQQLEQVGLCGMLHDMGKMLTPLDVLNKPGKLTEEEFLIMKKHPNDGREILMSSGGVFPGAIDVAYGHHEWLNGGGYPRKLKTDQITPYTKMVAIVDAYDAITSNRAYDDGRTHMEALKILTKQRGTHFDQDYTIQFVDCIGIFPPGCIVELSSGEVGIVTEVDFRHKLRPKVIILLDEEKQICRERKIDLNKLDLDAEGNPYRIVQVVTAKKYNIDIHKYHKEQVIVTAEVMM